VGQHVLVVAGPLADLGDLVGGLLGGVLVEVVSKLTIEFEIKEGEEAQPEEYIQIFRGLRFKPDAEIGLEGRF